MPRLVEGKLLSALPQRLGALEASLSPDGARWPAQRRPGVRRRCRSALRGREPGAGREHLAEVRSLQGTSQGQRGDRRTAQGGNAGEGTLTAADPRSLYQCARFGNSVVGASFQLARNLAGKLETCPHSYARSFSHSEAT